MTRSLLLLTPFALSLFAGCFMAGTWTGDDGASATDAVLRSPASCRSACIDAAADCDNDPGCRALTECVEQQGCSGRECVAQCACMLGIGEMDTAAILFGRFASCVILECTDCQQFGGWGGVVNCLEGCTNCDIECQRECSKDDAFNQWVQCVEQGLMDG